MSSYPILYHGSSEPHLTAIDAQDPGYQGSLGYGAYLTTDPEFALVFGRYLYKTPPPVPDDQVAYIDVEPYECDNPLTMYTPESTPFSFTIRPQGGGDAVRYSVLGDCDEQVKNDLTAHALADQAIAIMESAAKILSGQADRDLALAVIDRGLEAGDGSEDIAENAVEALFVNDNIDEADANKIEEELTTMLELHAVDADTSVEERLGLELDLDDLAGEMQHLGYSALFIDGYAPGNEYIVWDERFLPIPVAPSDG